MNRCNLGYTNQRKEANKKAIDYQSSCMITENFYQLPQTIVKAHSSERNQVNKKQTRKSNLITNQANSVLHDNKNFFTNIPKTIVKAQSNERN